MRDSRGKRRDSSPEIEICFIRNVDGFAVVNSELRVGDRELTCLEFYLYVVCYYSGFPTKTFALLFNLVLYFVDV